jgi:hypothetical protein
MRTQIGIIHENMWTDPKLCRDNPMWTDPKFMKKKKLDYSNTSWDY